MFNVVGTLLLIFFGAFADAQTDGRNLPTVKTENNEVLDDESAPPEAKHILKEFQEILGGGDTSNSVKDALKYIASKQGLINWVTSFNLKRGFSQICRLYHIRAADKRVCIHVSNLAFALPLSQAIEMLSGPLLTSLSTAVGLPTYITGAISITGTIISLPGIDPVCVLIFASYPFRPVQNTLTWVREKTFFTLHYVGNISGITKLTQSLSQQWHVSLLERSHNTVSYTNDSVIVLMPTGTTLLLDWDDTRSYFHGVRFYARDLTSITPYELKDLLEPLPGNVTEALIELRGLLRGNIPHPYYIEEINQDDDGTTSVRWRAHAVRSKYLASCVDLLSAK